nr:ATP-binding protein [Falsiroseomonas tokyonensis]
MLTISAGDISHRLRSDNPWWSGPLDLGRAPYSLPRRAYFNPLCKLVRAPIKRAVILLGSRRVGKTTMLQQMIGEFATSGELGPVLYASIDTPTYTDLALSQFLALFEKEQHHDPDGPRLVIFDEIQYLKDWERHLKDLVDRYPATRFVCSGSATAALKRRSEESGAGRFTDFNLPPLTFAEFLAFTGREETLVRRTERQGRVPLFSALDLPSLNDAFLDYLNYGGYPEAVMNPAIRDEFQRFVGNDIVQKVLAHDLPSLYGIQDIQELKRLFNAIAYNTGQEVSLDDLSKNASVAKNTILRYLEYLEAAFLIHTVRRVDEKAQRFQRQMNFKVYLTNPSMRAALFGPVAANSQALGALAETATITQWLHSADLPNVHYARWNKRGGGEVDIVFIDPATGRPIYAYDVKWTDRPAEDHRELESLVHFTRQTGRMPLGCSTKTQSATVIYADHEVTLFPLALHCYRVGWLNVTEARLMERLAHVAADAAPEGV